ncbi:MAG: HAD hydrolase family protein [Phycisphaeraceae bacterium]|nr:HAD hydrolase family protein [Phycisphaeraceae bacterium]
MATMPRPATPEYPKAFLDAAAKVRILGLDVDGTLTDGGLYINEDLVETRRFCVRDGQGIALWHRLGYTTAIVTARPMRGAIKRARELGVAHLFDSVEDKRRTFLELLKTLGLTPEQAAFVGDDLSDMRVMHTVGCPIAVGDADSTIKAFSLYTTTAPGGHGAVREAIWAILSSQNKIDQAVALYT